MVEFSEIRLKHEDDQDELDLGLSIGGSFKKSEKFKPVKKVYGFTVDSKPDGYYADVKENRLASSRSSVSPSSSRDAEPVEAQTKREMHALRRQEAKRKREEKQQQKRGAFIPGNGESVNKLQTGEQLALKKDWRYDYASNVNMNASDEQMRMLLQQHLHHNALTNPAPLRAVSATAETTCTQVQYVPFTNGVSGFPCVMPCWVPGGGAFEPSGCGSFRSYKGSQSPVLNLSNGSESDHNSVKDGGNGKTASSGSPHCSSSALSEDHSSSRKGVGGTSESRSHSSHSLPEKHQLKGWKSNDTMGHSEHSASSEPVESNKGNRDGIIHIDKLLPSNTAQSGPTRPKEETMPEPAAEATKTKPSDKHLANTENATPCSVKETKVEMGKPPKPQAQDQNTTTTSLPQMPYVSTTGNGPNGKTITGFLYRFTKSEVSIICVCHGSTFSPAEFVQHAGSTGVSHPLKHITVIPSPLG